MRKLKENNKKTHLSFKNNINTELKLLRIYTQEIILSGFVSSRNMQNYTITHYLIFKYLRFVT